MEDEGTVVSQATGLAKGREGGGRPRKIYQVLWTMDELTDRRRRPSGGRIGDGRAQNHFFGSGSCVSFRRSLHAVPTGRFAFAFRTL